MVRRAAYDREQAERDEACPWMAERRARFAALEEGEPFQDWWVERAVAAHRRDCPACRQALALAGDPAPPGPPLPSGPLARLLWGEPWLPPALRLPAHSLAVGVFFGAGMAAIDGLLSWGWTWSASPEGFLWSSLGAAWFWFTWGTLRPLADREPVKAGRIQAAALTVPALLAWGALGSADLANPLLWGAGALVYWLLAGMLGVIFDPDIDEATRQAVYPDVLPRDAGARGGGETDREAAE